MGSNGHLGQENTLIEKLTHIVLDNLQNEQFGVSELAKMAGISRSQLHRKLTFKRKQSVSQFIREIRLKEAYKLLEKEDITASEVAYKVGFNNPSYFSNCFHEYFGFTPGEVKHHLSNSSNPTLNDKLKKTNKTGFERYYKLVYVVLIILLLIIGFSIVKKNKVPKEPSIAILPFDNLSSLDDNQYFADGIVEDLLNKLSTIDDLKVISRTSSEVFRNRDDKTIPQIASILDVNYIVEGSVQREGDNIRMNIQLIDALKDDHILSKQYNRKLDEIFAIQSDIASQIISELSIHLTSKKVVEITKNPTDNLDAFNNYSIGHLHYCNCTQEEIRESMKYFKKALKYDSTFALAYAGLARSHLRLSAYFWTDEPKSARDSAAFFAQKALESDGSLAEAHTILASLYFEVDANIPEAEKEFQIAIALNPNSSETYKQYAYYLNLRRKYDQARKYINMAIALDPLNHLVRSASTLLYIDEGNFEYALKEAKVLQQIHKEDSNFQERFFQIYLGLGDEKAAYESLKKAAIINGNLSEQSIDSAYNAAGIKGLMLYKLKHEKIHIIKAHGYALIGDMEKAMEWLEITYKDNCLGPGQLHWVGHANKELLNDPRYISLLYKIGLDESIFY